MKRVYLTAFAVIAGWALSPALAQATPVNLTTTDVAIPHDGISVATPALYEGLAKTTPPDLSEFASRQPRLRNESLPQDLRNKNEVKKVEKKTN